MRSWRNGIERAKRDGRGAELCIAHDPRLLSDNSSAYVSGELRDYLDERKMTRPDGATSHLKRDFAAGIL